MSQSLKAVFNALGKPTRKPTQQETSSATELSPSTAQVATPSTKVASQSSWKNALEQCMTRLDRQDCTPGSTK